MSDVACGLLNIHDNVIVSNANGGGIRVWISDGEIYNNQIKGHSSSMTSYPSIYLYGDYYHPGNVNVYGNTLLNNRTANSAVIIQDCISSIYDNIIKGNTSQISGSLHIQNCDAEIYNNIIKNNGITSYYYSGGLFISGSTANIYNNIINNNISSGSGSGLSIQYSTANIYNNIINSNMIFPLYPFYKGSGIACINSSVKLVNNTFIDNNAEVIYLINNPSLIMINNIIAGDNASIGVYKGAGSSISEFKNNCFYDIQDDAYFYYEGYYPPYIRTQFGLNNISGIDTSGNIVADPLMDTDNMHLQSTSPCIDAGIDAKPYISSLTSDIFGNKRPYPGEGQYDIGANEASIGIVTNAQLVCTFEYDAMNRVIMQSNANATFSTYKYDEAGNLLQLFHRKENLDIIEKFCYTYDMVGNRMSMTNLDGSVGYQYDNTYQLKVAYYSDGQHESFVYDPVGNRSWHSKNQVSITYTYDEDDRLLTTTDNLQLTTVYKYDANGNQTNSITGGVVTKYEYNEENLLKRYTAPGSPGVVAEYQYDPFGRRVKKSVDGINEHFIYDGIKMGSDVLADYDNSLNLKTKYVMNPRRRDTPLASIIPPSSVIPAQAGTYHYYHDGLGSVNALADKNSDIKNEYKYYAFGSSRLKTETIANRYQYTSREYNNESGLYYYRSRSYNPILGRFIQKDKKYFGINWYVYVKNNCIRSIDPFGYYPFNVNGIIYIYCETEDLHGIIRKTVPVIDEEGIREELRAEAKTFLEGQCQGTIDWDEYEYPYILGILTVGIMTCDNPDADGRYTIDYGLRSYPQPGGCYAID